MRTRFSVSPTRTLVIEEDVYEEADLRSDLVDFGELVELFCGPPAAQNQGHREQVHFMNGLLQHEDFKEHIRRLLIRAEDLGLNDIREGCCILGPEAQRTTRQRFPGPTMILGNREIHYSISLNFPFGSATFARPEVARENLLNHDIDGYAKPSVDGFVVIKAAEFLKLGKTVRKQDLNPALFVPADKVKTILFISHVWEKDGHPDPGPGPIYRQLKGVQAFLRHIETVLERSPKCNWGVKNLELSHGQFQAAVVVGRGQKQRGTGASEWTGLQSLDDVGIWYDFMCLPQGADRTDAEKDIFQKSLAGLANFIAHKTVYIVALRFEDEKSKPYEDRGWCQAEFTCRVGRPVVYWPGRDGDPVTDEEVYDVSGLGSAGRHELPSVAELWQNHCNSKDFAELGSFADWFDSRPGQAASMGIYPEGVGGPHLIAPTNSRIEKMARCVSDRLVNPPCALQHDIDLEVWIPDIMAEFGFHVTNGKDAALVGFMMLYWANYDEIDSRKLFARAMLRRANKQRLVIKFIGLSPSRIIPWKF